MTASRDALRYLSWNWAEAYQITGTGEHWTARRRDNGRTLAANGPDRLRELIVANYATQPVTRDDAPGSRHA
jgi:hypothetical protein